MNFLDSFDFTGFSDMLIRIIPALLCITLHELAHGYTAYLLGDDTAKRAGRLSLNPFRHMDFIGAIMILVMGFGWAKAVPVNMYNFKNPKKGMAITALAGPLCNILISALALFIYGVTAVKLMYTAAGEIVLRILASTAYVSCAFAVFNLLPVPPLDGSKILFSVISEKSYRFLMRYERYGMIILLALVLTGILSGPLNALVNGLYNLLCPIAEIGFRATATALL